MSPPVNRLMWVDCLRAVAALWVLAVHLLYLGPGPVVRSDGLHKPITQLAGIGYLGVTLFLVLSGFCLFYPVVSRGTRREWWVPPVRFLKRRWLRIAPPYYVALLLLVAASLLKGLYYQPSPLGQWWDLLLHLLFLHNLVPGSAANYNFVFWSLALEFQLYLSFPILLFCARRIGVIWVAVCTLGLSIGWNEVLIRIIGESFELDRGATLWNALPARLWDFTCGMVAAFLVSSTRVCRGALSVVVVGVPLGLAISIPEVGPIKDGVPYKALQHWVWAPTFAALAVAGCRLNPHWSWSWLGSIRQWSYSLYLVHVPLIIVTLGVLAKYSVLDLPTALVAALIVSLIGGYIFYRLFERPFLRLGRLSQDTKRLAPVRAEPQTAEL